VSAPPARRAWYSILYVQVLLAIAIGVAVGYFDPQLGVQLKPLGDGFIALIRMMIAPVIFCTIVHGIASIGDLRKVGRVGIKTLFYFEAVSTLARRRSIPMRSRAMSRAPRKRASSTISWGSFPTRSWARWRGATCCRYCWSPSWPGSRSP
jgi:hypothetical protein